VAEPVAVSDSDVEAEALAASGSIAGGD